MHGVHDLHDIKDYVAVIFQMIYISVTNVHISVMNQRLPVMDYIPAGLNKFLLVAILTFSPPQKIGKKLLCVKKILAFEKCLRYLKLGI